MDDRKGGTRPLFDKCGENASTCMEDLVLVLVLVLVVVVIVIVVPSEANTNMNANVRVRGMNLLFLRFLGADDVSRLL